MEDNFYDSLDEDSFCDCQSQFSDENQKSIDVEKLDDLTEIIPLYQKEIPKKTLQTIQKKFKGNNEMRKKLNKDLIPVKEKKKQNSYLNMFYTKVKYPIIGGGDVLRWNSGSDTTRANCDPRSRKSSAILADNCENFEDDNEYWSDEESFYANFIEEEKLKSNCESEKISDNGSTSGIISNLVSVSEQYINKDTSKNKKNSRKRNYSKASSIPSQSGVSNIDEYSKKLQLLRKRQFYGKAASTRNKALMEEAQLMKSFKTNLKI